MRVAQLPRGATPPTKLACRTLRTPAWRGGRIAGEERTVTAPAWLREWGPKVGRAPARSEREGAARVPFNWRTSLTGASSRPPTASAQQRLATADTTGVFSRTWSTSGQASRSRESCAMLPAAWATLDKQTAAESPAAARIYFDPCCPPVGRQALGGAGLTCGEPWSPPSS